MPVYRVGVAAPLGKATCHNSLKVRADSEGAARTTAQSLMADHVATSHHREMVPSAVQVTDLALLIEVKD